MAAFDVTVFYFGGGLTRHYDAEVLAEPALLAAVGDGRDGGGLIFEDEAERILIDDDFDHLLDEFLHRLPGVLRAGQDTEVRYHYSGDVVRITQSDGQVTFDFSGDRQLAGPREAVVAALEAAAGRLARIRAAARG